MVDYEIFDHPKLLETFINEIIDNEANLKMTLDQIEQVYCDGSFDNNNPLLKMMIIRFAHGDLAKEQILQRKWVTDEEIDYRGDYSFARALHHIYSSKVERGNEIHDVESLCPEYSSQSTIKFFHDNNLEFRINCSYCLVNFLKRLDHIEGGLPLKEVLPSIDKIIKFNDGNYKWNKDIFEKHLLQSKKENRISQEEYDKYIKLLSPVD